MSWLVVAIVSRFISGSSMVIDKILLKKYHPSPVSYTFWLGILGLASLALTPFGFQQLPSPQVILAIFTGCMFILAMFFMFQALSITEASHSLLLIGSITPVFTLIFSSPLTGRPFLPYEVTAFAMLLSGGFILYFGEEKELRFKAAVLASSSAFFLGLADSLTKLVFLGANFVTGFIWIKIGGTILVLAALGIPRIRKHVIRPKQETKPRNPFLYVCNRAYAGLGSVLIAYALFLGPAPLVDATLNLQYIFIMLGGWLVLKEKFHGKALLAKIISILLMSTGILWISAGNYLSASAPHPNRPILWGVSFSEKFSTMLGLDWKKNYEAILNDLGPKRLRLMVYWDMVEKENHAFDFNDLDYQMNLAEQSGARVILAIGQKVPRWPECHYPLWAKVLGKDERNAKLLEFLNETVSRYKNHPALLYWQVENEPFLSFGECPSIEAKFFDKEIALVKNLDSNHEIIATDSGELSLWYQTAERGDIFGTSIYRRVYNKIFGQTEYYLQPEFFRLKEKFSRFVTRDYKKKYIVVELGAEPWLKHQIYETPLDEQLKVFDLPYFRDTIGYAKQAGFDEYYLWGAEWWYWMKVKHDVPTFWNYAKSVINQ